ncbi:Alginate biosynthesis sensor protein KinB [compost metagenome]
MRDAVIDALRVSDRGLEGLIARMKDAAFVVEVSSGRIRLWNPAAGRLFGYTAAEAHGFPVGNLLGASHEVLVGAIASSMPVDLMAARKDGKGVAVELTLSPLGDNGLALAVLRDATDRQSSEQDRVRALKVLSHELRTPISTVMGFGALVFDGLAGPISDQQRHYLRRLLMAADDLHALVNDLLEIGPLHADRNPLHLQPFKLSEAVEAALDGLAPQAEAKGLTVVNQVPADLMAVRADGKRISQVLRNLLCNAIKFSPDAGTIGLRATLDDGELRCEIEDMGPGVPPEEQGRIFEPFVRLGDGTIPGIGLGLNIAKVLVEAHQGRIGIRSAPGRGSVFWFTLPVDPAETFAASGGNGPATSLG